MGLTLNVPEVQISWLLAVTISSKPLPQLFWGAWGRGIWESWSSSAQPEELSWSSALSLWIHSVLVERIHDLRSLLCALYLLNMGKLPAWLHPQNKQAACCCVLARANIGLSSSDSLQKPCVRDGLFHGTIQISNFQSVFFFFSFFSWWVPCGCVMRHVLNHIA